MLVAFENWTNWRRAALYVAQSSLVLRRMGGPRTSALAHELDALMARILQVGKSSEVKKEPDTAATVRRDHSNQR
jgi:hypothetical protein